MYLQPTRRHFLLSATSVGAVVGTGDWAGLLSLSPASAGEAAVTPELVRYSAELEPVIKLIAATPRKTCVEVMMEQMRKGLPYRHFLAALYLSTLKAPTIHTLHATLCTYAAHQLSLELPAQESLLPIFWALDNFKERLNSYEYGLDAQFAFKGPLPAADKAGEELRAGIEGGDAERAQKAIVSLIRSQGAHRVAEPLWHYMARCWGFIGHSAIFMSNAWRLLQTVGWEHAEPVLCQAVSLLCDAGKENDDGSELKSYTAHSQRIKKANGKLPADWAKPGSNPAFTKDLLELMRTGKSPEACDLAMKSLVDGKATAGAVWDAVLVGAGEAVICERGGNTPLHASTTANALRYGYEVSGRPENRLLLLLQGLTWMARYRKGDGNRPRVITDVTPVNIPEKKEAAAEEILATRSKDGQDAARKALAFGRKFPDSDVLFRAAARLVPAKAGRDTHNVKFPVAMFENYRWVSPEWRPYFLAEATFSFHGTGAPDNQVIKEVRQALKA